MRVSVRSAYLTERAARGIPPLGRRHVAGPLRRAEHLRRAGQILRVADAVGIAALRVHDRAHPPSLEQRRRVPGMFQVADATKLCGVFDAESA